MARGSQRGGRRGGGSEPTELGRASCIPTNAVPSPHEGPLAHTNPLHRAAHDVRVPGCSHVRMEGPCGSTLLMCHPLAAATACAAAPPPSAQRGAHPPPTYTPQSPQSWRGSGHAALPTAPHRALRGGAGCSGAWGAITASTAEGWRRPANGTGSRLPGSHKRVLRLMPRVRIAWRTGAADVEGGRSQAQGQTQHHACEQGRGARIERHAAKVVCAIAPLAHWSPGHRQHPTVAYGPCLRCTIDR